jgi:hypothetical protein
VSAWLYLLAADKERLAAKEGLKSWSQSFSSYPDRERGAMMAEFSVKDTIENLKQINERLARIEEYIGLIIEILSRHDLK